MRGKQIAKVTDAPILPVDVSSGSSGSLGQYLNQVPVSRTLSQVRALTASLAFPVYITDNGGGIYVYDSTDTTSTDNTGTVVVTAGGQRYKRDTLNGINVSWFGIDLTGTTDAAAQLQTIVNLGGVINMSGTIRINSNITLPTGAQLRGNKMTTLVIGSAVTMVFSAVSKSNLEVSGFNVTRASGNTNSPLLLHVQQCDNVTCNNNTTAGVLGLQTYRPAYSGATAASCCTNVAACFNTIKSTGSGPYGGAISLNFINGATIIGNIIDTSLHGIQWWGGDGNYVNGENNNTSTASKWAKNITISDNKVSNISGGGIWGSMGENITITGNTVIGCGDVGLDPEASANVILQGNTVANCTNAALSTFYGSNNIAFKDNHIFQRSQDGHGYHAYGNIASKKVAIMGGTITCLSTSMEAIFTEDNLLSDFTLGGGLFMSTRYRAIKFQRTSNVNINNITIQCEVLNVDGGARPHAIYVQGGDNINIGAGTTFQYTGSGAAGAIYLSDGGSTRPVSNVRVESIKAPGFTLGIKNDQFEGLTGNTTNRFYNNQIEAFDITSGSVIRENNKNAVGVPVDTYLKQFSLVTTGTTGGTAGYAPFLTIPVSASNTFDYARVAVMVGGWTAAQRKLITLEASNRDSFSANYKIETDIGSVSNNIVGYQNADGSITFYVNCGTFNKVTVTYLALLQSTGVSSLVFTNSTPTGTLVYDTSTNAASSNSNLFVQGVTAQSRSGQITTGNFTTMNPPSGFNAILPAVTGMPYSGNWVVSVHHHEDPAGPGGGSYWSVLAIDLLKLGVVYQGGTNGGGGWLGWSKMGMVPTLSTVTGNSQMVTNGKYITNSASLLILTLPTDANIAVGEQVFVRGLGSGGWKIAQNASQLIHGATNSTAGTGGSIASGSRYDTITLEKIATNEFTVVAGRGTYTIV